jgi:hypothetical protein
MKPLPETPELLAVAERVVWFKPPAEALAEPIHFLAHVMTWGTVEDLRALDGVVGPDDFREALENAPPGIFDARSWAYWNLKYGRQPTPPLPVRFTSSDERQTNTDKPLQSGTSLHPRAAD